MPQVIVHATPETGYFDYPPVVHTLDVTIRRPPLLNPPPRHPACWVGYYIQMKGILEATEPGLNVPLNIFSIHVTGFLDVPSYFDYFNLQSSIPLGGDRFAVEYLVNPLYDKTGLDTYMLGDPEISRTVALTLKLHHNRRDFELTELTGIWVTGVDCGELPPDGPPDGDDFGDDDDDSAGASGQYRAIEADSPRNWLHIGSGASIVTYHTTPEDLAFSSGAHAPKWWKQFCYNQRHSGALACLGRDSTDGSSTVYLSHDGGQSTEEVFNVTGTSVIMDYDSEREWLVVLAEGTPPDVEDPTSHGVVSRFISRDFGQNFTAEGSVTMDGNPLSARLLGMTYDPRTGGTLYLLCKILGVTKILASEDGGDSWEERFS